MSQEWVSTCRMSRLSPARMVLSAKLGSGMALSFAFQRELTYCVQVCPLFSIVLVSYGCIIGDCPFGGAPVR